MRLLLLVDRHYGHFRAMSGLAEQLQDRGHMVRFACPDQSFAQRMAQAGWSTITAPWLNSSDFPAPARSSIEMLRHKLDVAPLGAMKLHQDFPWDLALIDPFLLWAYPYLVRVAPCAALSTKPLLTPDAMVPPWTSTVVPSPSLLGRLTVRQTWWNARARYTWYRMHCWLQEQASGVSHRTLSAMARQASAHDPLDWACRPLAIDMRYRSAGELVLHAREFDLPRRAPLEPGTAYLGPCLASAKHRNADNRIDVKAGLIVCSLGTEMPDAEAIRRYRCVIAAMKHLPQARLLISTGKPALAQQLAAGNPSAAQVEVHSWIDLPKALGSATAAILHGGANSAKEAIAARCPILALPARADQPGIAARIVYHGLGRSLPRVHPAAVADALGMMIRDQALHGRLERMARCFERYDHDQVASHIIEDLALKRRVPHQPTGV